MPRKARLKYQDTGGWYHLYNKPAGFTGEYPLEKHYVYRPLIDQLQRYAQVYCCGVASFEVMGNHFHAVVRFDPPRQLTKEQLLQRALHLYSSEELETWTTTQWARFGVRIFDVSEMMRNLGAAFAKWYNTTYSRKGVFWADRFKSTLLADPQAVLDCIAYVELNAVRAGLQARPEDWDAGSLHLRETGRDDWLIPLSEFYAEGGERNYESFKELIYYRGAVKTKEGQHVISPELLAQERKRGFARRGMYLEKFRCFTDGLMLGAQAVVAEQLARCQKAGEYLRRVNPIAVGAGALFALREQRSHNKRV